MKQSHRKPHLSHTETLVHRLPPSIIHCLLLLPEAAQVLAELRALGNSTPLLRALAGVNLQQGPDPLAEAAVALRTDRAVRPMLQETLRHTEHVHQAS